MDNVCCACYMCMLMSFNEIYCDKSLSSKSPSISVLLPDDKKLCLSDFPLSGILKDNTKLKY